MIVKRNQRTGRGFTLVELIIVIVILGILAAIVIPKFLSASETARINSLRMNLSRMRLQLEVYEQQHGVFPTLADFVDQMTLASNLSGTTAAIGTPGFPYGPYIVDMPVNTYTNTATIGSGAVGSSAWYYDQATGEFLGNDSAQSRTY